MPPAQLAGALGQTPVLIIAGDADPYATPGSIEENAATLQAAGAQVEARRYPGGHGIPAPVLLDVAGPGGGAYFSWQRAGCMLRRSAR